jgi:iron complex transport system ATP-binding protein
VSVLRLVRRISVEHGIGVIVIIHDVNLAARFCDWMVALKGGRLVCQGAPLEFMTAARLGQIYEIGMSVFTHPDSGDAVAYVSE